MERKGEEEQPSWEERRSTRAARRAGSKRVFGMRRRCRSCALRDEMRGKKGETLKGVVTISSVGPRQNAGGQIARPKFARSGLLSIGALPIFYGVIPTFGIKPNESQNVWEIPNFGLAK